MPSFSKVAKYCPLLQDDESSKQMHTWNGTITLKNWNNGVATFAPQTCWTQLHESNLTKEGSENPLVSSHWKFGQDWHEKSRVWNFPFDVGLKIQMGTNGASAEGMQHEILTSLFEPLRKAQHRSYSSWNNINKVPCIVQYVISDIII